MILIAFFSYITAKSLSDPESSVVVLFVVFAYILFHLSIIVLARIASATVYFISNVYHFLFLLLNHTMMCAARCAIYYV